MIRSNPEYNATEAAPSTVYPSAPSERIDPETGATLITIEKVFEGDSNMAEPKSTIATVIMEKN